MKLNVIDIIKNNPDDLLERKKSFTLKFANLVIALNEKEYIEKDAKKIINNSVKHDKINTVVKSAIINNCIPIGRC